MNTYTITFNIEYTFSVRINGGEPIINQSPISVNEGDSISVVMAAEDRPTATMGGESIAVYSEGPDTFYFTIESVTGDIVVSD